jgi:hypothetical protein
MNPRALVISWADKPTQAKEAPQSPIDSVSPAMSTTSVQEALQLPRQRPARLFDVPRSTDTTQGPHIRPSSC